MRRLLRNFSRAFDLAWTRPKGWRSVLYNTAMAKIRLTGPLMMPVHISIEPTNLCNARCPVCETGNLSLARMPGMLDFANFRKLIDEVAPHATTLMYYFMGEPFLNKHAYDMIRYARDKGLWVETCTNGDFVDAKGVIYSDINQISFQIGGMTQETHQIYRVRSDLNKIHKNLYALLEERPKHLESNVQIDVGLIVMKHNEHQVPEFLRWAKEIGVDTANVVDPCVRTVAEGHALLPEDRRYWFYDQAAFEKGILKPKKIPDNECLWIWNSVMINWDGSVVPCCRDPHGLHVFGNVFETPLSDIWNGSEMRAFRKRILTDQGNVEICKLCSSYSVPELKRTKATHFSIVRHSIDPTPIEIIAERELRAVTGDEDEPRAAAG